MGPQGCCMPEANAMAQNGGLWDWLSSFGGSCGFKAQPKLGPMWVKATPDLFPLEVPGMEAELLAKIRQPGGSLDDKMSEVEEAFRNSARHLESLQQVLRKRKLDRMEHMASAGVAMPDEVREVIKEGTYVESFLCLRWPSLSDPQRRDSART